MDAIILHKKTWMTSMWYDIDLYPIDKAKYIVLKFLNK